MKPLFCFNENYPADQDFNGDIINMFNQQSKMQCRLCSSDVEFSLSKQLLGKYEVSFYKCNLCKCLQSEMPYWLDEAYGGERQIPDLGMASRTLELQSLVYFVTKALKLSSADDVIDWGGGNGLLVRMMRDMGINAYLFDIYARNFYAIGFEHCEKRKCCLITSFETWEHFVEPAKELESFFDLKPEYILISTGLYRGQDSSWKYLTPLSGRHVFFYSVEGREFVAKKFGYSMITRGGLTLYARHPIPYFQRLKLRFIFSRKGGRMLRLVFPLFPKDKTLIDSDRQMATKYIAELGMVGKINWP